MENLWDKFIWEIILSFYVEWDSMLLRISTLTVLFFVFLAFLAWL
jgi:hypothetical protein